ncbi:MAG: GspMb/PilO family protein [bacterium]|nr:GspMb/PilO family protein [bacterium]
MRKQNKTIAGLIIIAVILTLYIFGWVNPLLKRYWQINNNLQQKQVQLEKYQALLLNKNEYHQKTLILKNELKRIKNSLYVSPTPLIATSELLGNLETISKNTNVNIISQNILKAKKTGKYQQIFVMLNGQTNSEGLTKFLYAIKTADKLYSIPYLNIFVQENNKLKVGIIISSFMIEGL